MANYSQQMQSIFAEYQKEHGEAPADLRVVGQWAMGRGLWAPRPIDMVTRFAAEMADALREEMRTDSKGRRYRSKLAVRGRTVSGEQMSLWGDIDTAPRAHVEKSIQQRRRNIVGDCFQLKQDVDHFNDTRAEERPIPLVLDFTDDVLEEEVKAGLWDDKAA